MKEDGKVKKVIVTGCLAQRYADELAGAPCCAVLHRARSQGGRGGAALCPTAAPEERSLRGGPGEGGPARRSPTCPLACRATARG